MADLLGNVLWNRSSAKADQRRVLDVDRILRSLLLHVAPARHELGEQALDHLQVSRRIDTARLEEEPVGDLLRRDAAAGRREVDEHEALEDALDELALLVDLEEL